MLNIDYSGYTEENLKIAIENEIIIAKNRNSLFAHYVSLNLLSSALSLIEKKDEEIAKLRETVNQGITYTLKLNEEQAKQLEDRILESHEYNIQAIYEKAIKNHSARMRETLCHNSDGKLNGKPYLYHESIRILIERETENLIGEGI